jgi:Lysophospholipase L1 and related esterases
VNIVRCAGFLTTLLLLCLGGAGGEAHAAADKPTVYLIGDSTVRNGTEGQQGWGEPFAALFDPEKAVVNNRALGGRSSRTYYTEGLWEKVRAQLKPGDYVLMQFGHNDGGELNTGPRPRASLKGNGDDEREVVMEATGAKEIVRSYGWYLRRYIADTKAAGAIPIVLSPVPRKIWNEGRVARASGDYGKWAKEAAAQGGALFVDLNEIVARRYEAMGPEKVEALFADARTHTNEAGAKINAEAVAEGIRGLKDCPLAGLLKPATAAPADTTTP